VLFNILQEKLHETMYQRSLNAAQQSAVSYFGPQNLQIQNTISAHNNKNWQSEQRFYRVKGGFEDG